MSHTHGIVDEENDETGPPPPAKKSNTPPQSCTTVSATDSFRKHKFNQERNGIIGPAFLDGPDGPDKPGRTGLRTGLRTATVEIVQK